MDHTMHFWVRKWMFRPRLLFWNMLVAYKSWMNIEPLEGLRLLLIDWKSVQMKGAFSVFFHYSRTKNEVNGISNCPAEALHWQWRTSHAEDAVPITSKRFKILRKKHRRSQQWQLCKPILEKDGWLRWPAGEWFISIQWWVRDARCARFLGKAYYCPVKDTPRNGLWDPQLS